MKDSFKQCLRSWLPPALSRLKGTLFSSEISFNGDFPEWNDALAVTSGYDSNGILEKARKAALAVASGEAVFERDSVLFDEVQYSWPVLAGLLKAAADEEGHLRVLDFGGALGSSYYQNRKFLEQLKEVKWCIVEQDNFVECGKREFETDVLKFFHSIEAAAKTCTFNVILLSSVLPYLERPYDMLAKVIELGVETVIIDRTPLLPGNADRLTVQQVPDIIYRASYPAWFLGEDKLLKYLSSRYEIFFEFESLKDKIKLVKPKVFAKGKGFILKRKKQ